MTTDYFTFFTDFFYRRAYFHLSRSPLIKAEGDASLGQIVGRHLYPNLIARKNLDVVHPHLPRNMAQNNMTILEFDPKHCVREGFKNGPYNLDYFLCISTHNCVP